MKVLQAFFIINIFLGLSVARSQSKAKYAYPKGKAELQQNSIIQWSVENFSHQEKLKEIKFNIVNGNFDYAKILLNEADLTSNFTKTIQLRYLALIYFIEGNYQFVLNTLNKKEMKNFSVQAKVCFMKVLSEIILDRNENAAISWRACRDATSTYSETNLAWMQIIVDLKTSKDKSYVDKLFKQINIDNVEEKYLRIYLKLALFLNKQDKIIPRFKYFGKSPLENKIQRELIGLNYYRNGDLTKAYQLLEGIDTANAEVFKGNIFLFQKKYELAFAQYKLALQRKSNSRNALDRLIPLSWKLNQWNEGLTFLQRIPLHVDETIENYTLMAAYLTMANKHNSARTYINKIIQLTNKGEPIEVSQISVLNLLKLKNYDLIEDSAASSCSANDGMNCWLLFAINSWEDLGEYTETDKKIHTGQVNLADRLLNGKDTTPIEEDTLLNQKDIQELDNDLINLISEK
jgi:hypothetical protein